MVSPLTVAFLAITAGSAATVAAPANDPPIRLKLSDRTFAWGDHAKVRIKTQSDGYLLVLRRDTAGHLRILYPLSPDDEGGIDGGREFEVRGRSDREAFTVDDREGSGIVLAAVSDKPFNFEPFSHNGHWDLHALAAADSSGDGEDGLLAMVDQMTDRHYDYDVADYQVARSHSWPHSAGWHDPWYWGDYPCLGCGPWSARLGLGWGFQFGRPFHHGHWH
jgi:hypothetical protein